MIIDVGDVITVLFTDGDICECDNVINKLHPLGIERSLAVGEKIIEALEKMEKQNDTIEEQKAKLNEQKAKINARLHKLLK